MGDTWHLDEVFVTIQGRHQYLWRAVDEDGDVLDILLVQSHRNRRATVRFFRTLLKTQGRIPRRLITDQLRCYAAACRTVMPSVVHVTDQYANNRAEVSHQLTRQRERQMRRFKSAALAAERVRANDLEAEQRTVHTKLTVSMIPLPIGVALRHGGCRWAMA